MSLRIALPHRPWVLRAGLLALTVVVALLVLTRGGPPPLPTVSSLAMPVPRAPLDRTVTIGFTRGVIGHGGTRFHVQSRFGQFRGHWRWGRGWVYLSGSVLPGTRIHIHVDRRSLTLTETPGAHAFAQLRRFGKAGYVGVLQVNVVRFGIGGILVSNPTKGGPFGGRHVMDELADRAWSERGLTMTRDRVSFSPTNAVQCDTVTRSPAWWDVGCPVFGQEPLVADRRGRFVSSPQLVVGAKTVSLTRVTATSTRLPTASMHIQW